MSTQHFTDDRQHGHAIRRRQGGRTSIYHDQLYPVSAVEKAYSSALGSWGSELDALRDVQGIRGSDGSTGAY